MAAARANVAAWIMNHSNLVGNKINWNANFDFTCFNTKYSKAINSVSFIETYSLKAGLRKFGQKGQAAVHKEMKQLHDWGVFKPIHPKNLSTSERRKILESLMFLVGKRDGTIEAWTCANGSAQRARMGKDDALSPTLSMEAIMLTAVIDAIEEKHVITVDIPNAFVQTDVSTDNHGYWIIVVIKGPLVDMLMQREPETPMCHWEGKEGSMFTHQESNYGMLQSGLLYYQKFRKEIRSSNQSCFKGLLCFVFSKWLQSWRKSSVRTSGSPPAQLLRCSMSSSLISHQNGLWCMSSRKKRCHGASFQLTIFTTIPQHKKLLYSVFWGQLPPLHHLLCITCICHGQRSQQVSCWFCVNFGCSF